MVNEPPGRVTPGSDWMKRSIKPLSYSLIPLALAAGGWFVWQHGAAARDWEHGRPALPALAGAAAPGPDARVAAAAARFAQWPPDRDALAEFSQLCAANGQLPEAMQGFRALV